MSVHMPTYRAWAAMKRRCYNPRAVNFKYYGGKGVAVCRRWRDSFGAFLSDMGNKPEGHTLDRFPNKNGNYEPGNCRWANQKSQCNNKSTNRIVELDGQSHTVSEWAELIGIPASRISARLDKLGMPASVALTPGKRSARGLPKNARTW